MGSGHAFDMIRSWKLNRSWVAKRKPYKEIKEMYQNNLAVHHIDFKKATPTQLAQIRKDLIQYNKRKTRKSIILIAIILAILLGVAYIILVQNIFHIQK